MNLILVMAVKAAIDSLANMKDQDRRDSDKVCAITLALVLWHLESQEEQTPG